MSREELVSEIAECEHYISGLSNLMKDFYGAKDKDIAKNCLIKDYMKRIEKAKKELEKLESGDE